MNQNPVIQVLMIGGLAIVVGFLLLTRVMGGGSDTAATATTTPATPTTDPATGAVPATAAPPAAVPAPAPAAVPDATAGTTAPTVPPAPVVPAAPSAFKAGPGLPAGLVAAHQNGLTVALLVSRYHGVDDHKLRPIVRALRGQSDVALFTTSVYNVSRYSRVTSGVDLSRVPALIVIQPEKGKSDAPPKATVSYGFRGPESVTQAIHDARYKGPTLPYYPK
jgi:hypothetical protein